MTTKEKAKELWNDFYELTTEDIYSGINRELAKQCALICCDEIMLELENYAGVPVGYSYWNKVKQEIKKL